jgi:putative chitinase
MPVVPPVVSKPLFSRLAPRASYERWRDPLTAAMGRFQIDSPARIAAFLAQIAHESDHFLRVRENLHYTSLEALQRAFGTKRFPDAQAAAPYLRNAERLANFVYANRMGNGAPDSGDGARFLGRGLIQLTGKNNYVACMLGTGLDCLVWPEVIETPDAAALSAAWFWHSNGLNKLADAGDFTRITQRINGGTHGLTARQSLWETAKAALAIPS